MFDGAPRALAELSRAGFALVVVTNQSAIARGEVSFDELHRVHAWLGDVFADAGAPIERFYVCPHHPSEGFAPYLRSCACRKPAPGLVLRAIAELDLDPARSWMVGDALRDVRAGLAAGTRALLVETGKGERERGAIPIEFARTIIVARDLASAATTILAQSR